MPHKTILSFDVEEFDTPLEYGKNMSMDEQMHVSETGLRAVLGLLEAHQVTATFFTTANFALHHPLRTAITIRVSGMPTFKSQGMRWKISSKNP